VSPQHRQGAGLPCAAGTQSSSLLLALLSSEERPFDLEDFFFECFFSFYSQDRP
jgi:hypothetical protein